MSRLCALLNIPHFQSLLTNVTGRFIKVEHNFLTVWRWEVDVFFISSNFSCLANVTVKIRRSRRRCVPEKPPEMASTVGEKDEVSVGDEGCLVI